MKALRTFFLSRCLNLLTLLSVSLWIGSCVGDDIIVYGSATCGFTQSMRGALDEHGFDYVFYDVNQNPEKSQEMFEKVRAAYPNTSQIGFPVVDVNGVVLIRPTIEEVEAEAR